MPVFTFHALTAGGRTEHGVVDADSPRSAWQALRARGLYPTDVRAADGGAAGRARPRPTAADLASALRQLATLVQAGVPVADALDAVVEAGVPAVLAGALVAARARVREGASLADALGAVPGVFPPLHRALVRAAEASGALGPVLVRLAEHAEASAALGARLRAATTYPAIMLGVTTIVFAFLLARVVPEIARLFAETGTPLPLATRALLALVDVVRATWWAWVLALAGAAAAGRSWLATPAGRARWDAALLALPLAGRLVRHAATARLARTLATVLGSGVPLESGLALAADTAGNAAVAAAVHAAREAVRGGEPLARALATTAVLPPLLVRLVAIGEVGGTLVPALERAADSYEHEVAAALDTVTRVLEPALVVVAGAAVLVLVLGILVPVLTLDPVGAR
ncbi:MAG: type II secretion system F family protein [Candidatus Binatia bacterium]